MRVKSSAIRIGDIVNNYGMRIRIDETHTYPSTNNDGQTVYAHLGTVLNRDEVIKAGYVPASFMCRFDRNDVWVVQGNDLATWNVEEPELSQEQSLRNAMRSAAGTSAYADLKAQVKTLAEESADITSCAYCGYRRMHAVDCARPR